MTEGSARPSWDPSTFIPRGSKWNNEHSGNTIPWHLGTAYGLAYCFTLGAEFQEPHMANSDHNKAAELHESAAKSHRAAAEQHGKGDHAKGMEHSKSAQQHSQSASKQSDQAHAKSQQQK
jgi:hypothetical protein